MVSQAKERVDSLVKEQLPVDSLIKKLRDQDCGCTNSGDGDAGDRSAVCVCGQETYLLDVRLLAVGNCGALNFVCNLAACEPETFLRGVCREGLLKHRARATAVLKKTVLDTVC
ncbi:hypothetical protein BgiBS90_018762 [Biomphalaria glabrata]|nr:hypothetical protein BgiBS90_018762 [Biomphalaria glabrata]